MGLVAIDAVAPFKGHVLHGTPPFFLLPVAGLTKHGQRCAQEGFFRSHMCFMAGQALSFFIRHMAYRVVVKAHLINVAGIAKHSLFHNQGGFLKEFVACVAAFALFFADRLMYGVAGFGLILKVADEAGVDAGQVGFPEMGVGVMATEACLVGEVDVLMGRDVLLIPVTGCTKATGAGRRQFGQKPERDKKGKQYDDNEH
jgi:hypothetical protein